MDLCLFEDAHVPHLRPLVETRAAFDLRLGIRSVVETTCDAFGIGAENLALHTRPALAGVTQREHPGAQVLSVTDSTRGNRLTGAVLFANARWIATSETVNILQQALRSRDRGCAFVVGDAVVAAWMPNADFPADVFSRPDLTPVFSDLPTEELGEAPVMVRHPWDLLGHIDPSIRRDFDDLLAYNILEDVYDRTDASVHPSVVATAPENIYIAPGATVRPGAILDGSTGPVYLDSGSTVLEHAVVKGPVYLGRKSQIKIHADVANAAIGTWSKVGGEVHDCVLHSFSNKGHQGFLGHSYLGRWCNLGADTNTSNLKNDYGDVTAYDPAQGEFVGTGRQFAGLFMGDHSKCGINTMFNTGTVVGTGCNLFGGDFPPRYVPPFSWGGPRDGFTAYRIDKALAVADTVMQRRDTYLDEAEAELLRHLHDESAPERSA
jgi:UDP-N-acetylglucosamine diphosphorylase/glucosamine-1-phosphate N-acetyltransferase